MVEAPQPQIVILCRCQGILGSTMMPCQVRATQEDGLCDGCRHLGRERGVSCCEDLEWSDQGMGSELRVRTDRQAPVPRSPGTSQDAGNAIGT